MKNLFTIFLIGLSLAGTCQIIDTYAGNGITGQSGDGGPATAAELYNPFYLSADNQGNLYIDCVTSGYYRKVDVSTHIITTIAGTGVQAYNGDNIQATAAELNYPLGSAEDAAGNIYISDQGNSRVRRIDAITGIITTIAGNGTAGSSGDGGQATAAELNFPSGLSIDKSGNLFVSDALGAKVREINMSTGIITNIAGNGTVGYSGDGGQATAAELNQPFGTIVDQLGNVYIADGLNYVVRKVDAVTGIISTFAGNGTSGYSGDGGPATAAEMTNCYNVALDASGNVYIADYGNLVVRKVDFLTGNISTFAGDHIAGYSGDGGPATAAEMGSNLGLASDVMGNLFIGDVSNQNVRIVSGLPTTSKNISVAGKELTILPNPGNGMFTLKIKKKNFSSNYLISVYDMLGQKVLVQTGAYKDNDISLDLSRQNDGIYFVKLALTDGTLFTQKIEIIK